MRSESIGALRTYNSKVREHRVHVAPHLMRDRCLKPGFFSRGLREPWPNCCDVEQAKVLAQNAAAEAKSLDDEIVEEIVR